MNWLWDLYNKLFYPQTTETAAERTETSDKPRLPLLKMIFNPYNLLIDNFRTYVLTASVYSFILSLVSILSSYSYMCLINTYRQTHTCGNNLLVYLAIHLLTLLFMSVYAVRWYGITANRRSFSLKYLLTPTMLDLKAFGFVLLMIMLSSIALLSLYMLYQREVTPDWRLELVYFTIVGSGMLAPFVLMRFYAYFGFIWGGEKIPSIKATWLNTRGNTLPILMSFMLIFMMAIFTLTAFNGKIKLVEDKNAFYTAFAVEYVYNMLVFLLFSFFANHCILQKLYLFGGKNNVR